MRKVVLIRPAVFLHERFESTPILGKIKWRLLREHGISRFAGFLENEIIWETLIVIFVNSSPKGLSWPNMKKFDSLVLTLNSRYLQSAAHLIPITIPLGLENPWLLMLFACLFFLIEKCF